MAIFRYEAADVNGKILRGAMEGTNPQEVVRRLNERGFRSVQIAGTSTAAVPASSAPATGGWAFGARVAPEDLALFFRQLGSLVHAGFTVPAALADLAPRTQNKPIRNAAFQMARETASGGAFAAALSRHPLLFPPHVLGLVAAGETGGFVEFALEECALNFEQDAALRRGLWLPKLLIWQAIWSVLLFQPLFPSINPENVTAGFVRYGMILLFLCVPLGIAMHLGAAAAGWWWRQPGNAGTRDRLALRIPVMARVAKMRALASFTRLLRRLLMSGISPEPAFTAAAKAVPNTVLSNRLIAGVPLIRAGRGLDAAVEATGMMDHDPVQMLVTGQKTGQWLEMLDRVTAYYQDEAARATDAAKSAQKQLGVVITLISMGYVTIVATHGMLTMGMKWTDSWTTE